MDFYLTFLVTFATYFFVYTSWISNTNHRILLFANAQPQSYSSYYQNYLSRNKNAAATTTTGEKLQKNNVYDDCICPSTFDPICGSDFRTYRNSCELRCEQRVNAIPPTAAADRAATNNNNKAAGGKLRTVYSLYYGECGVTRNSYYGSNLVVASPPPLQPQTLEPSNAPPPNYVVPPGFNVFNAPISPPMSNGPPPAMPPPPPSPPYDPRSSLPPPGAQPQQLYLLPAYNSYSGTQFLPENTIGYGLAVNYGQSIPAPNVQQPTLLAACNWYCPPAVSSPYTPTYRPPISDIIGKSPYLTNIGGYFSFSPSRPGLHFSDRFYTDLSLCDQFGSVYDSECEYWRAACKARFKSLLLDRQPCSSSSSSNSVGPTTTVTLPNDDYSSFRSKYDTLSYILGPAGYNGSTSARSSKSELLLGGNSKSGGGKESADEIIVDVVAPPSKRVPTFRKSSNFTALNNNINSSTATNTNTPASNNSSSNIIIASSRTPLRFGSVAPFAAAASGQAVQMVAMPTANSTMNNTEQPRTARVLEDVDEIILESANSAQHKPVSTANTTLQAKLKMV